MNISDSEVVKWTKKQECYGALGESARKDYKRLKKLGETYLAREALDESLGYREKAQIIGTILQDFEGKVNEYR